MATGRTVLVLAGGSPVDTDLRRALPDAPLVVAADSGIGQAARLGYRVDIAVGDFDSAAPRDVDATEAAGARIERHPGEKDATDLELALEAAEREGAARVVVAGIDGGRLDHFLANLLLLAAPRFRSLVIEAVLAGGRVRVVHDRAELAGRPGDVLSLLPVGGTASGIRTDGLRYPLAGEDLAPGTTRGVSNEFTAERAAVSLTGGTLLAVQPTGSRS